MKHIDVAERLRRQSFCVCEFSHDWKKKEPSRTSSFVLNPLFSANVPFPLIAAIFISEHKTAHLSRVHGADFQESEFNQLSNKILYALPSFNQCTRMLFTIRKSRYGSDQIISSFSKFTTALQNKLVITMQKILSIFAYFNMTLLHYKREKLGREFFFLMLGLHQLRAFITNLSSSFLYPTMWKENS